jgi:hypothetical protein
MRLLGFGEWEALQSRASSSVVEDDARSEAACERCVLPGTHGDDEALTTLLCDLERELSHAVGRAEDEGLCPAASLLLHREMAVG